MANDSPTKARGVCANCGVPLTGPYCAACGQKDGENHPSLLHLAEDYLESISHADARIWRTLGYMAVKPGEVTKQFLSGKRASFIPPVRFYFFVSVIFFLILAFANVALVQFEPKLIDFKPASVFAGGSDKSGTQPVLVVEATTFVLLDTVRAANATIPPDVLADIQKDANRVAQSFVFGLQEMANDPVRANALVATWIPRFLIGLMPLFAAWLWLITLRKGPLFDHLVFSLYFHAFIFLVLSVLVLAASAAGASVPGRVWSTTFGVLVVGHLFFALRRAYDLGWLRTGITFVLALVGYGLGLILAQVAVLAPILLGD